jgi:Flp pilus assembly protein TadD
VAQLKEQGNSLFVAKNHEEAASKYTEAIALDGRNAILYANRAACYLALQRHVRLD